MPAAIPIILGGGLWTPALVQTAIWFDLADASTVTLNGSTVSQINDKSGNRRNATQATASLQPVYSTALFGGQGTLLFDALDDFISYDGTFMANTNYTVFAMFSRNSSTGSNFFVGGTTAATNSQFLIGFASPGTILRWGQFGNDVDTTGITYTLNKGYIFVARHSTTEAKSTWIDGSAGATSANTVSLISNNGARLGRLNTGLSFAGNFGELVIFTSAVSTDIRQRMEGYYAWKWGLVGNLPADHPYKFSPPRA